MSPTIEAFKSWLQSKKPDAVVGVKQSCYECVVAEFLFHLGAPAPHVSDYSYCLDSQGNEDEDEYLDLPYKFQSFIAWADAPSQPHILTAGRCLEWFNA